MVAELNRGMKYTISIQPIKISSETIVTVDESKFYIKTKNSIRNSTIDICAYDFK